MGVWEWKVKLVIWVRKQCIIFQDSFWRFLRVCVAFFIFIFFVYLFFLFVPPEPVEDGTFESYSAFFLILN
jgi:hypothetical protein